MPETRTILVTGATGKQGGATLQALAGAHGFSLRALTRNPDSEKARSVARTGVTVVRGDFDDAASLTQALSGVWGVFAMQNTWEAGVVKEEEQGKRFATIAREAGVHHFVYTSVGSAHRRTGIPHFENKRRIEETVRTLKFPSHVIIRPVFFMENLITPWFLNGDNLTAAMDPGTVLQMIATEDIGKYAARAFIEAARLSGREIDIAGDAATMPQAAATLSRRFGRSIEFVRIPIEDVRKNSEEVAQMLEWFDRVGYDADIAGLELEFGIKPTSLDAWAARQPHH